MAMQLLPVRVEPDVMSRIIVYAEANGLDRSVAGRRAIEAGLPILEGEGRPCVALSADVELAVSWIAKRYNLTPERAVEFALIQAASHIVAQMDRTPIATADELTGDELEAAPPADDALGDSLSADECREIVTALMEPIIQ